MNRWSLLLGCCIAVAAWSATPRLEEFSHGIGMTPLSDRPVAQVVLPDAVYQVATRGDLADLRVFDRDGQVVPHALCPSPDREPPVVTTVELPVVELRRALATRQGEQVRVATGSGTRIDIDQAGTESAADGNPAHVIDATGIDAELRWLEFDWQAVDGTSEARVRIDASDDLDRWEAAVDETTLLRAGTQGELRRDRVALPQRQYRYLRVTRMDGGAALHIENVLAESVAPGRAIEPVWFPATADRVTDQGQVFRSDRNAPVQYARFSLPFDNTSTRITLQSRRDEELPFAHTWSGEAYSLVTDGQLTTAAPAQFPPSYDREWLLQVQGTGLQIGLELGYRPLTLRFITQGAGPYTLAYGSRRAPAAEHTDCNQMLSQFDADALQSMLGDVSLDAPHSLGGAEALRPLPEKTPMRLIVLWGVLILGVGLLVAMALSLLRRVKHD